jgi:hypothetical protein
MRHVALVVGSWFVMMDPGDEFDVDEDVVEDVVVEDVVGEDVVVEDVEDEEDEAEEEERENPAVLRHRQFHREIFRLYGPSSFDLCARPASWRELLEGRGNCQLASISTTPSPAISKDTRTIRESHHLPVEEQVVVTSAQDPAKLSSNSMSLYLCLRPKACRKTMTPPIAARTGTRTPARAKEDT